MTLTIELTPEQEKVLAERARSAGMDVEDYARGVVLKEIDLVDDDAVDQLMDRIIQRNSQLYHRLA